MHIQSKVTTPSFTNLSDINQHTFVVPTAVLTRTQFLYINIGSTSMTTLMIGWFWIEETKQPENTQITKI